MRLRLFAVVCVALLLAGCFGVSPSRKTGGDGKSYVKLTINWDSLDADPLVRPQSFTTMSVSEDVSVIGARVVAPDINALLAQSATRQAAETQGIITIPVPATDNANLYAVALSESGEVLMLGYLKGIAIPASTVLTVTSDELTWVTPDAYFSGKVVWTTPDGVFVQNVNPEVLATQSLEAPVEVARQGCGVSPKCYAEVSLVVSDPFESSQAHPMICMAGMSVSTPCEGSVRRIDETWISPALMCRSTGEECSGRAYVNGPLFSLPGNYLFGPQFGPMKINWQP